MSVSETPPAKNCSELYYDHHVFASGQYLIEPEVGHTYTVLCQIEDRELCNGSLLHGASAHLHSLHDGCVSGLHEMSLFNSNSPTQTSVLNQLSPYVVPETSPYTLCQGEITINFRHKVLINGLYNDGSGFSTIMLTYTYINQTVSNWTTNTTYQYRDTNYGDPTTITTTPGIFQPLRPFVADSLTLTVQDTPDTARMKLDLFGCEFNVSLENTLPWQYTAWSCYYWPSAKTGVTIHKSESSADSLHSTGTDFATMFKIHQTDYWSLAQEMPLGRALDEAGCAGETSKCSFLATLLNTSGELQCGLQSQFANDLTDGYMEFESGNVSVGCQEDGVEVFRKMNGKMSSNYYSKCPTDGHALHQMNYDKYQQSLPICVSNEITEGEGEGGSANVSPTFTQCQQESGTGGGGGPVFQAPLYRNLYFHCNYDYVYVLSEKFGGSFVEHNHEGSSVNRRTVGQISKGHCQCPHTTTGQDLNEQEFMCGPDFTYDLRTFLGCETITCQTPPAEAPAEATREWDEENTQGTIITYTCNTQFLFETDGWPSNVTSECQCSKEWQYQNDTLPPNCRPTCPSPDDPLESGANFSSASQTPYVDGTELMYTCDDGMGGSVSFGDGASEHNLTCQSDHTWDPTPDSIPTCLDINCFLKL
ncbi:hypothetical protein Pmani_006651 [Petrolisthes manimaculis]|uniref:Sushi domain-containing protein n=1 Tax=Petrolisthes manimaculis TaxID=1843537 RepID=A0AAE1Q9W8_9EUCA|nr:hypothetical protein Pmani_006651 [Petrolisthes manimaculis]